MRKNIDYASTAIYILLCFSFMIGGCGSDANNNSSNSPVLVQSIPLYANGLNGNGNIIVASYTDSSNAGANTGFKETLKIYRQDPLNADLLLDLGGIGDVVTEMEFLGVTYEVPQVVIRPEVVFLCRREVR